MELKELQQHIRTLATLEETAAPFISCYLNLENGSAACREPFESRVRLLQKSLTETEARDFVEAADGIRDYLGKELRPESKGVAIFACGGAEAFFLPLQFRVPLPNWIVVGSTPNIFHLVELKDTYDRYVILLSTEESARILEVNLGEVTKELWRERPELRQRVGREWTKEHYQNHRRQRTEQFIKEQVQLLEQLMTAGGHTHLILAGNPRIAARVREALPKHLAARLPQMGETVAASGSDRLADVVAATLDSFVEEEERESRAVVEKLMQEIHRHGLGVAGLHATLAALQQGNVDVLVLAKNFDPEPGWRCVACQHLGPDRNRYEHCPDCGAHELTEIDLREEMARLAERIGCHVEVVNHSDRLMQLDGVGALLRYYAPELY
jgi:rubrerythrin